MANITIKTNNVPRNLIYGYQLTAKERKEFDYISDEDIVTRDFFRYKGRIYDIQEFMRIDNHSDSGMRQWQGYHSDSFFSGILIKYVNDNEQIIVGTYYC
jgi:hypothetical protein